MYSHNTLRKFYVVSSSILKRLPGAGIKSLFVWMPSPHITYLHSHTSGGMNTTIDLPYLATRNLDMVCLTFQTSTSVRRTMAVVLIHALTLKEAIDANVTKVTSWTVLTDMLVLVSMSVRIVTTKCRRDDD